MMYTQLPDDDLQTQLRQFISSDRPMTRQDLYELRANPAARQLMRRILIEAGAESREL